MFHCSRECRARKVRDALALRLESLGLRLHPGKTEIVYCKDANRRGSPSEYVVHVPRVSVPSSPRGERNGKLFTTFSPAIGPDDLKAKGQEVRDWQIHKRVGSDLTELAAWINPVAHGWMNYYGN